jgi:hypothetical protein
MAALGLLAKLRETDLGYQAATTSSILQVVCEAQLQHSRSGRYMREIDWREVIANHGYQLVSYG